MCRRTEQGQATGRSWPLMSRHNPPLLIGFDSTSDVALRASGDKSRVEEASANSRHTVSTPKPLHHLPYAIAILGRPNVHIGISKPQILRSSMWRLECVTTTWFPHARQYLAISKAIRKPDADFDNTLERSAAMAAIQGGDAPAYVKSGHFLAHGSGACMRNW